MTFQLLLLGTHKTSFVPCTGGVSPAPPCSTGLPIPSIPSIPAQGTASLQAGDGTTPGRRGGGTECPPTHSSASLVGPHVPALPGHTWLLWDSASISLESLGGAVIPLEGISPMIHHTWLCRRMSPSCTAVTGLQHCICVTQAMLMHQPNWL